MTKLLATDGEGERLDRFELIAELASGGMATVFLARLSGVAGFQRLVAIKRLHPHLAKEPEFIEMFLDEARLAARIHHPNVVPIQEVGTSERGYYLVMDYVEGDTLARLLARAAQGKRQIPPGVVIRVLLDVLAGLHAAHELKDDLGQPLSIVHRDVSPQNVLVGVDGIARITDFGVARAASRLTTTRSGQLKGKLAYMAPEQARGEAIDRRADIFSCGIVLWEALALKRLFKGDGEAQTLNRVLYDPIAPPSSVRPDVPRPLEDVCMKALDRDPEKRFASAQEFADELEKAARSLSCVGSVRDVATCLHDVVGTDLDQQRDAVRSWLARSEPSGKSVKSLPPPPLSSKGTPLVDSVKTRVEGKSEPSTARRVDPGAVTAPAPPEIPEKVSSVSSAVLRVDPHAAPPASSRPRSRMPIVLPLAVIALLGAAGVGAWGAKKMGAAGPPPPTNERDPSHQAPTTTPPPPTTPSAVAHDPAPPTSATTAPSASLATTATASATAKKVIPVIPITRPTATAKPAASVVPDDLNKNPYR